MDTEFNSQSQDIPIRKIEDIIEIQKENGNFNIRQVAFKLPSETNSDTSTSYGKNLETGLSKVKLKKNKKNAKRLQQKHSKATSDVFTWPSDSDITVLRMKLCTNENKNKMINVVLGDGLHQPDSSSMVNLATLVLQSQTTSKHNLNLEEYLLPLTSWEHGISPTSYHKDSIKPIVQISKSSGIKCDNQGPGSPCCQEDDLSFRNSDVSSEKTVKSKVARFLRLYFCPCCTCLYNLETMQETKRNYE